MGVGVHVINVIPSHLLRLGGPSPTGAPKQAPSRTSSYAERSAYSQLVGCAEVLRQLACSCDPFVLENMRLSYTNARACGCHLAWYAGRLRSPRPGQAATAAAAHAKYSWTSPAVGMALGPRTMHGPTNLPEP
jgi:hypothetical protein